MKYKREEKKNAPHTEHKYQDTIGFIGEFSVLFDFILFAFTGHQHNNNADKYKSTFTFTCTLALFECCKWSNSRSRVPSTASAPQHTPPTTATAKTANGIAVILFLYAAHINICASPRLALFQLYIIFAMYFSLEDSRFSALVSNASF